MNAEETSEYYSTKKRRIFVTLLAYSAVLGFIIVFLPEEDTPLDLLMGLPALVLAIMWCFTDADERNYRIGMITKIALVLVFIFGFPLYVFQTRGIRGFKTLALTMLVALAMFACMVATMLVTMFTGEALGVWDATL